MKDKTKQNLVQRNFRTTPEAADALRQVAKKIGIKLEMITSDAIHAHYGEETREIAARRRLCVQALRELAEEGKVVWFPATPNRRSVHGPCTVTAEEITLNDCTGNPIDELPYGLPELPQLPSLTTEAAFPLAA